ncbi:MAG: hypothetical protein J6K39_04110 [Clostridia bacterium]|nr:hypothetical protein [Clostridia bacterium]
MKKSEKALLKNINEIYKKGYIPARGNQTYKYVAKSANSEVSELVNCFAHACFNLTNQQLTDCQITSESSRIFWKFPIDGFRSHDILRMKKILAQTGLEVKRCKADQRPENNQWKVAFYCDGAWGDIHFMLQERNGTWSSKLGAQRKIEKFGTTYPPKKYDTYKLHSFYMITNPYITPTPSGEFCR